MTISIVEPNIAQEPQDSEIILSVQNVSKKFCRDLRRSLLYGVQDIAGELTGSRNAATQLRRDEFWALSNVSFQLRRGEALGLVGKNGSGKTTMLRIIAGLIKPDNGMVEVMGRVAPLIALGAGFNPILTGRENIYANMSILGLSKQEIDQRFEAVVDFAEIGTAIDAPVQSYSSGMAARLGFATAIYTEPDILLVDEVLAVGDSRFRGKCFQKLHELRQRGTSFVLVSHNAHSILTVCESAVYLRQGELMGAGDTATIMNQYERELFLSEVGEGNDADSGSLAALKKRPSAGLEIHSLYFQDAHGQKITAPVTGEPAYFCVGCQVQEPLNNVSITFSIRGLAMGGETVLVFNSLNDEVSLNLLPGEHEIQLQMPHLGLKLGAYVMDVYVKKERLYHLDCVESFRFNVDGGKDNMSRCMFYQPRTWNVNSPHPLTTLAPDAPDTQNALNTPNAPNAHTLHSNTL